MEEARVLRTKITWLLWFFITALVASGLTAFPIQSEIIILERMIGEGSAMGAFWPTMAQWISFVHRGITTAYSEYPFLAYGTDWLAFAHIVIAIAFIGPLRDPVKNIWVIEFGMIACVLLVPLALICGPLRGIPFFWCMVDCSFGVFGLIPLWFVRRYIVRLAELQPKAGQTENVGAEPSPTT